MGYFDTPTRHLDGLPRYPGVIRPRSFVPRDVPMRFDADAMPDIDHWVRHTAADCCSSTAARTRRWRSTSSPAPATPRLLWAPRADHGVAIADLAEPDRAAAVALLTRWARLQ
jgi:hypothetical protein